MSLFQKFAIERTLRSLHGWIGALLLPWIVLAGFTGLYMNHSKLILSLFPASAEVSAREFEGDPRARQVNGSIDAGLLVSGLLPEDKVTFDRQKTVNGRVVFRFKGADATILVDKLTGHTRVFHRYRTHSFAPNGDSLGGGLRWGRILSSLHKRGWVGTALGRWLADITAGALVLFGISGMVLFHAPRLRRRKNRRARKKAIAAAQAQPSAGPRPGPGRGPGAGALPAE